MQTPRDFHLSLLLVGAVLLAGCDAVRREAAAFPTFNKDIAPMVFSNCVPCHRPGQIAPFSLVTFADVHQRAARIAEVTEARQMPPWLPEPGYGEFANERRLTDDQVSTFKRWVENGSIEGAATDRPPVPSWPETWQLGMPDLVVAFPRPYVLQAGEDDVFRNFVLSVDVPSTRFIRGMEFRPGNAKAVHHAIIGVDPTAGSRRLDAADPEPGYEGMFSEHFHNPEGHFLSWTPGKTPYLDPPDMGWRLNRGTDVVVQMHMLPSDQPQVIQPELGFFFSDDPPGRSLVTVNLTSTTIDIPAGDSEYVVEDSYPLPVDADVLSVYPHAHYVGKEMKVFATLPDGRTKWLLWIKQWNFYWQDLYRYARPVTLPRGTTITMRYTYDNSRGSSKGSRHGSDHLPRRVLYGPHSSDEMAELWLQVQTQSAADAAVLLRDNERHGLDASLKGAEKQVRDAPNEAGPRNFLGARLLQVGRVQEATAALREAVRLNPDYPEAHNNLGEALRAQGNVDEAVSHFRRALGFRPKDDGIRLSLANALKSVGRLDEAIREYRQSIAINAMSAEAHNNLGAALGAANRVDEAMRHFERALTLNPDYADAHNNIAIALGVLGKFDEAIRHVARALEIRPDSVDALNNREALLKAAAQRRAGRF